MTIKKYRINLPYYDRDGEELAFANIFREGFGVEEDSRDCSLADINESDIEELLAESDATERLLNESDLTEEEKEEARNNCYVFFREVLGYDLLDTAFLIFLEESTYFGEDLYENFQNVAHDKCETVLENMCDTVESGDDFSEFIVSIDEDNIDDLENELYKALDVANSEVTNDGTISFTDKCEELDNAVLFEQHINFSDIYDDFYEPVEIEEI